MELGAEGSVSERMESGLESLLGEEEEEEASSEPMVVDAAWNGEHNYAPLVDLGSDADDDLVELAIALSLQDQVSVVSTVKDPCQDVSFGFCGGVGVGVLSLHCLLPWWSWQ